MTTSPVPQDPRSFVTPLRCIFWGGLLCVFDFNISSSVNGRGWSFDVLNDLLGMLLITASVFRLASASAASDYRSLMAFVKLAAVLSTLTALDDHLIYTRPPLLLAVFAVIGLLALVGFVVFCTAMIRLCGEWVFPVSQQSWRTTRVLFMAIYLVPLGIFYLAALGALMTGSYFHIDLGPMALPLLVVLFVPLIHLFVSTSRMKHEAERAS